MKNRTIIFLLLILGLYGVYKIDTLISKKKEQKAWEELTNNAEKRIKEFEVDERLKAIVIEKFSHNPETEQKLDEINDPDYLWFFSEDEEYYHAEQRAINITIPHISNMVATYRINKQTDEIEIYERINGNWLSVEAQE